MDTIGKLLTGVLVWETGAALLRHGNRKVLFAQAQSQALTAGRPLVVVGDPDGGVWTKIFPAYGCGDVCVDLYGCPKCPTQIKADLTRGTGIKSDSAVVFVSCVFEYIEDLPAAWTEVKRIAGSVDNIFVVRVQRWTFSSFMVPGAKWKLLTAPPSSPVLVARRVDGLFKGDGNFMGV